MHVSNTKQFIDKILISNQSEAIKKLINKKKYKQLSKR